LLRPVVAPTPAQAQGSRKTQYLFYTCQNTVGEDFSIKEDRFQAVARITGEKVKSGWQLKEVVPDSQTASLLLILEK